jgi:hypothetical protein
MPTITDLNAGEIVRKENLQSSPNVRTGRKTHGRWP